MAKKIAKKRTVKAKPQNKVLAIVMQPVVLAKTGFNKVIAYFK